MTRTVSEDPSRERIAEAVRRYDFSAAGMDNDPYGEHDFGAIEVGGRKYFWKIDYYDPTFSWHSEDPTDPDKTRRVLTIMRADEY